MSAITNIDKDFKGEVQTLKKEFKRVTDAYQNFAIEKLIFAQKLFKIRLKAKQLDGEDDGEHAYHLRQHMEELIQTTNESIMSRWALIGQYADSLMPHAKHLPAQRDSLYALSQEVKRSPARNKIGKWIEDGKLTIDSSIRDVNALSIALRTPKKKHDGTNARYVKVTFLIDSDYKGSFNIFKDIIQSNKIKEVRSDDALKSVAKSELDEPTFNKISGKFK